MRAKVPPAKRSTGSIATKATVSVLPLAFRLGGSRGIVMSTLFSPALGATIAVERDKGQH